VNILFLSLTKITKSSFEAQNIYLDLIKSFEREGHAITILSPIQKREKDIYIDKFERGNITVYNLQIDNITKTNVFQKVLAMFTVNYHFKKNIRRINNSHFDLLLYTTPPITLYGTVKTAKKTFKAKTYLLLKDIFPQNAVDLNMLSIFNPLYWYFRQKEKKYYQISDYIGTMSKANTEYLLKHNKGLKADCVEECPNTITPISIHLTDEERQAIRYKYRLPQDKTLFVYGGTLGKPQGIDFIIDVLRKNETNTETFILIIGSGAMFNKLNKEFQVSNFQNAKLLKQLPKEDYETMLNACDVGLVFLDYRFTIPNFPSRLLSYLQASLPVLAATDPNTDLKDVILDGKFGFWCKSNNVEKFNSLMNRLTDEQLRKDMGRRGRNYLETHYTTDVAANTILKHFRN